MTAFLSLLGVGFLLGLRHALEVDHVAAVVNLTSSLKSVRAALRHGLTWGLGHTVTLFLFSLVVLLIDTVVPEFLAHGLEFIVGVMLVFLGVDTLRRIYQQRIHLHIHTHDGVEHAHFHSHAHSDSHEHQHAPLWRTLIVGMIHGMAGSAALILLTLGTVQSFWQGLLYVLLFGVGSMLGMGLLSAALTVPLLMTEKRLGALQQGLQGLVGCGTIFLGAVVMLENLNWWL